MCDCYYHKCEFCEKELDIHIADYCTDRENVSVVCPWCNRKKKNKGAIRNLKQNAASVLEEKITARDTVRLGNDYIGRPLRDDIALIVCRDPQAYGIHLNQPPARR